MRTRRAVDFEILMAAQTVMEIAEQMDLLAADVFEGHVNPEFHRATEIGFVRRGTEMIVVITDHSGVREIRTHRRTRQGAALRVMNMVNRA